VNYDEFLIDIIKDYVMNVRHESGCELSYIWTDGDDVTILDPNLILAVSDEELEEKKQEYINREKLATYESINAGFEFEGNVYQSEEKDQINYLSFYSIRDTLVNGVDITLKNGNIVSVPQNKIESLALASFNHKNEKIEAYRLKKQSILNSKTLLELINI
jgi:hypothetical protein